MPMNMELETKEVRTPRSFTLKPSTIALIEEYATIKGTNASRTVEALCVHFLPRIIKEERASA